MRIGIFGTFDVENYGDILFPIIAKAELERRLPILELVPFSYHHKSTPDWPYNVEALHDLARQVEDLDGVLIGGGHLIRFDADVAGGYAPASPLIHHPTGYWLGPALTAGLRGLPLAWNAPSASPGTPRWARPLLKLALENSQYVALRDRVSLDEMRAIGFAGECAVVPDTVFGLRRLLTLEDARARAGGILADAGIEREYIVLQASPHLDSLARQLAQRTEIHERFDILLVPIGPILGDSAALFRTILPQARVAGFPEPLDLASLIACSAGSIAQSLHLTITSLCYGLPVLRGTDVHLPKYEFLRQIRAVSLAGSGGDPFARFLERAGKRRTENFVEQAQDLLSTHWDRVAETFGSQSETREERWRGVQALWSELPSAIDEFELERSAEVGMLCQQFEEISRTRDEIGAEQEGLRTELKRLSEHAAQVTQALEAVSDECDRLRTYNQELRAALDDAQSALAEQERLRTELKRLSEHAAQVTQALKDASDDGESHRRRGAELQIALDEERAAQAQALAERERQLVELGEALSASQNDVSALRNQAVALTAERDRLSVLLDAVYRSTSWKIARPLRASVRVARGEISLKAAASIVARGIAGMLRPRSGGVPQPASLSAPSENARPPGPSVPAVLGGADLAGSADQLKYYLDLPLPERILVGEGQILLVSGWALSLTARIEKLHLRFGDQTFDLCEHSSVRTDVFRDPANPRSRNSLFSGFWGLITIEKTTKEELRKLRLIATTSEGETLNREVGDIRLLPGTGQSEDQIVWPGTGPKVAICMATFNPPAELFRRQIESLRRQSTSNWLCFISDDRSDEDIWREALSVIEGDARFVISRSSERLGFYKNFERAMKMVPPDADYVALCDQDDEWRDHKLETLMKRMKHDVMLVYSDCRIVDTNGNVRAETFWYNRRNNWTNLSALLVANTVTGAASLFRASLLRTILPFPERVGDAYHDHWVALIASASGKLDYVDAPLYDYVQHGANVIGHNYDQSAPGIVRYGFEVLRRARRLAHALEAARIVTTHGITNYRFVVRTVLFSRLILLRTNNPRPLAARTFRRFSTYNESLLMAFMEKVRAMVERRPTLNLEGLLLYSMLMKRALNVYHRARSRRLQSLPPSNGDPAPMEVLEAQCDSASVPAPPVDTAPALAYTRAIAHSISPITVRPSLDQPRRVNIFLARIDFKYVFGGYLGMFALALKLRREGHRVRIILIEEHNFAPEIWKKEIKKYPEVATLFDEVECIYRYDRTEPVDVNPDDAFVATNGWSAHVAHGTLRQMNRQGFLFIVQEYEPLFLSAGSVQALFMQSYDLPQFQLFSTKLLRDYFREKRIGVFREGAGADSSAVFSNAVSRFQPTAANLERSERRLIFYARPEAHAARNLFELGLLALMELTEEMRHELKDWSFYGMGSIGDASSLPLGGGKNLRMMPKAGLDEYRKVLPMHDVGLSLMLTPHPSLVPIEMASAGMWTVTNTYANKTEVRLREISSNILAVEPTLAGIKQGLRTAISKVDRHEERLAGSKISWPTSWDDAFPPMEMEKVLSYLRERSQ